MCEARRRTTTRESDEAQSSGQEYHLVNAESTILSVIRKNEMKKHVTCLLFCRNSLFFTR